VHPLSTSKPRWLSFVSLIERAQLQRAQQELPAGAEVATLGSGKYAASSVRSRSEGGEFEQRAFPATGAPGEVWGTQDARG
jgi:hypothetical protein